MKIGPRQERVLNAIITYYEKEGFLPSFEELRDLTGLKSVSTIHYHMRHLIELGFLTRVSGKSRAYKIVYTAKGEPYHFEALEAKNILELPIITTQMEGMDIFTRAQGEEKLYLPESIIGAKEGYALKVLDETMKEAGINQGDYLLFIGAQEAKDGDFVILLSGNKIAPARFHYNQGETSYDFFNQEDGMYADSAMMIGRVVGIYRDMR